MPDASREVVSHPIFARLFDGLSQAMERDARAREELLGALSGKVPELGAGNGTNFRRYTLLSLASPVAATATATPWDRSRPQAFRVERLRRFDLGPSRVVTRPHVVGLARA